ncbi:hypothetical protein [Burkholderia phage FLC9]|nr:hypothetical protein [Burkholderia phage FLC9]
MAEKCGHCMTPRKDQAAFCSVCGRPFPEVKVSEATAYWEVLPVMKDMARRLGWCLALYGPLRRDLDMIAVPWSEDAVAHDHLLRELVRTFGGKYSNEQLEPLSAPRKDVTVLCRKRLLRDNGSYIDVSVIDPRIPKLPRL